MKDHCTHYTLLYNAHPLDQQDKTMAFYEYEDWAHIKIPQLIELDPEGMAAKYGYTAKELTGKTDFEVMVNQEAYNLRNLGVLPKIGIADDLFIADLRLHQLRHAQQPEIVLRLKDFDLSSDGLAYFAFYHPATRQLRELDPKLTEFPDGVVKIQLPGEVELDPVFFARQYQINERDLLRRYPIQKETKAKVIPLSETGVPAMIQRNREDLQQQHRENAKRMKPRIRH
jgi:hypothetical protein